MGAIGYMAVRCKNTEDLRETIQQRYRKSICAYLMLKKLDLKSTRAISGHDQFLIIPQIPVIAFGFAVLDEP